MTGFFCGAASRDITPSFPVVLHGYESRDGPSVGSAEPITLGCLALADRSVEEQPRSSAGRSGCVGDAVPALLDPWCLHGLGGYRARGR